VRTFELSSPICEHGCRCVELCPGATSPSLIVRAFTNVKQRKRIKIGGDRPYSESVGRVRCLSAEKVTFIYRVLARVFTLPRSTRTMILFLLALEEAYPAGLYQEGGLITVFIRLVE